MIRRAPSSEKALSTITLLLFSLVLFFQASRSLPDGLFYIASILLLLVGFLCFVFIQTVFANNPSSSLPFLSFNSLLLGTIIMSKHINVFYAISLISITILGLIITSLKMYAKIKQLGTTQTYRKTDEINKELDDDWNEQPHLIFEKKKENNQSKRTRTTKK